MPGTVTGRGAAVGHRRADAAGPAADRRRRLGLVACELLGPVRFADLAGGRDDGAAVYGTVLAISFGAAALGAMADPALRRLLRGSTRLTCALLFALGAAALAVVAGPDVLLVAGAGFALYYLAHGSVAAAERGAAHPGAPPRTGRPPCRRCRWPWRWAGSLGNLAVPPLAAALGTEAGFLAVAVVVLLGAVACLRLPRTGDRQPRTADDGAPLAGGLRARNAPYTRSH